MAVKGLQETAGEAGRKAVRVRLHGRVQGVFFRAWTTEEANRRGLSGWVRNRADGTVEAVFSGPAERVDDMIAACHEGPPHAAVSRVETAPVGEGEGDLAPGQGFRQLPTA